MTGRIKRGRSGADADDAVRMPTPTDIASSLDRLREAHYWLHQMELNYHFANRFRWSLNSFLVALKEVRPILNRELQNKKGFKAWKEPVYERLRENQLLSYLIKTRDVAVHQDRIRLRSSGAIGLYQGGLRFAVGMPIDPDDDSDTAIISVLSRGDPFGLMTPDEDTMPCVRRFWRLPEYDEEVVQLCSMAWLAVGGLMSDAIRWLCAEEVEFDLTCRMHDDQMLFRLYDREALSRRLQMGSPRLCGGFQPRKRDRGTGP